MQVINHIKFSGFHESVAQMIVCHLCYYIKQDDKHAPAFQKKCSTSIFMVHLVQVKTAVTERKKWVDCIRRRQGLWPIRAKDREEEIQ
jgi:hypothetical protein